MSLRKLFESAVKELHNRQILFAVSGGFAADLYRRETRLTMDVDIAIMVHSHAKDTGISIIQSIGLSTGISRKADLAGGPLFAVRNKNTPPCIIVGRSDDQPDSEGVDILLPSIPWVENAVNRAQANQVDFGFGPIPTLTLEDVILSKLYSLNTAQLRAKDLDDLQSIFEADHEIDESYLAGQVQQLKITILPQAKPFLPECLVKLVKRSH